MDIAGKKILLVKLRYIGDTLSILPVVRHQLCWEIQNNLSEYYEQPDKFLFH